MGGECIRAHPRALPTRLDISARTSAHQRAPARTGADLRARCVRARPARPCAALRGPACPCAGPCSRLDQGRWIRPARRV